jgi:predicted dehydrogenase
MMKKLKSAVIGCGAISREHLAALSELENVEIVAVCDLSPARAQATAERFGITKWYSSHRQLVDDVRPDLVHITTPPTSHFPIARDCLGAGLNVLCEKPITPKYEEFCILKQSAIENRCLLLENQNYRFHSSVRRICELLHSGMIGEVIEVQIFLSLDLYSPSSPYIDQNAPYFATSLPGGVIGDFLTHIASLIDTFAGPVTELRTMWTKKNRLSIFPADEFRGFIKGECATAHVAFSGNAQPDCFWLRVLGTRMHAEANLFEPPRLTLRRLRSGEPALAKVIDGLAETRSTFSGTIRGFWRKLAGRSSYDGLQTFVEQTYRSLEKLAPPPVNLEQIDRVAWLVDRFTRSDLTI